MCYNSAMNLFLEMSFIFGFAAFMAFVMRSLRLPLMLGYVMTGIIGGPLMFNALHGSEHLEVFSQLGIAALLFIVGLTLNPGVIKEIGKTATLVGVGQFIFTAIPAYGIAYALGYGTVVSGYIAIGLTLSSTIVVSKILSDKKTLGSLHGKIAIGCLIIQDIIAALSLVVVTSLGQGGGVEGLFFSFARAAGLLVVMYLVGKFVLPRLTPVFAVSQDVLFLFSAGWGIGMAGIFHEAGLSLELGALAAGITLASSPYHQAIGSRMRVVRDFFLIVFFVTLGSQLGGSMTSSVLRAILVLTGFVLVGKPMIMMLLMGVLGFHRKTSFLASITMAQVSEFSFILLGLGIGVGHVSSSIAVTMTIIGCVTIAGSSLLMMYGERLYEWATPLIRFFPSRETTSQEHKDTEEVYEVILFGCHRLGEDFLPIIQSWKVPYLVVDFDPGIIHALRAKRIPCRYGDASDSLLLDDISLKKARLVISTLPDRDISHLILREASVKKGAPSVILVANTVAEAMELYKAGASYVIVPHELGGKYASMLLDLLQKDAKKFSLEKRKHVIHLHKRLTKKEDHSLDLHHRWNVLH